MFENASVILLSALAVVAVTLGVRRFLRQQQTSAVTDRASMIPRLFRRLDMLVLVVIALMSAALSILHFFALVEAHWFTERVPLFTLILLAFLSIHLLYSAVADEDFRHSILASLHSIAGQQSAKTDSTVYADTAALEGQLARRILEARRSVCDLTWKKRISEGFSATDRQLVHGYMDKAISEASSRITYREVFVFSDQRRLEKLERRLSENKDGYSCRYYREDPAIPRIQFVLIDDEEVFFFATGAGAPLASFHSRALCSVLRSYFDSIWEHARIIKDGPRINEKELTQLRKLKQKA